MGEFDNPFRDALRGLFHEATPEPSLLGPPRMRNGEPVRDYLTRVRTEPIEVRLVDGRGRTKIIRVPYGTTEWHVPRRQSPSRIVGTFTEETYEGVMALPAWYRVIDEIVFTSSPDCALFDRQGRAVWMPEATLKLPPQMWPRFQDDAPVMTEVDRQMHAELAQWAAVDGWDPHD